MSGYEVALILIGMLCGNLGAVVVQPLNLGLFWNSVIGGVAAAAVHMGVLRYLPHQTFHWSLEFLAAGAAGTGLMLICGGLVALAYRD